MNRCHYDQNIIFFDGQCNLCNGVIGFIIKKDRGKLFVYCSLQSEKAQKLLQNHYDFSSIDSLVLWQEGRLLTQSTAALLICTQLSTPIKWPAYVLLAIPLIVRDFCYSLISRYRYWLFGRRDVCHPPHPNERKLFYLLGVSKLTNFNQELKWAILAGRTIRVFSLARPRR